MSRNCSTLALAIPRDKLNDLTNSLRVAAERFAEDASTIRADPACAGKPAWERVAAQFDRQQADARALLALVVDAMDQDTANVLAAMDGEA